MAWIPATALLLAMAPMYGALDPTAPVRVQLGGKCGYVDRAGAYAIPARFDGEGDFHQGLAPVRIGRRFAYVDPRGRIAFRLPPGVRGKAFDGDPYAVIEGPHGQGFVARDGRIVIPPIYRSVDEFEGRPLTRVTNRRWRSALVDRAGRVVLGPVDGSIGPFFDGAFEVHDYPQAPARHVDARGESVLPVPEVDWAARFADRAEMVGPGRDSGVAFARPLGKKWSGPSGLIDREGRWSVAPVYDDMTLGDGADELTFILVSKGAKWGFIDARDRVVIPLLFDGLETFEGPVARAAIGDRWGLIDRSGLWALPPRYDGAMALSPGVAAVELNGKWGVMGRGGRWRIAPRFDSFDRCHPPGAENDAW